MHHEGNEEVIKAGFFAAAVAVIGFAVYVSHSTGASFMSVMQASTWTLVIFMFAGLVYHFMGNDHLPPIIAGLPVFIWPVWWPVLDSSACGGCSQDGGGLMPWQVFWWDDWYTKAGGEVLLLIVFAYVFIRWMNSPHRYY